MKLANLHELRLKIFGDVFESILGAVHLDSGNCLDTAWDAVVKQKLLPYFELFLAQGNNVNGSETIVNHRNYTGLVYELWA